MKNNFIKSVDISLADELEMAQMMVNDLQKLWDSYAKKALIAKQEREERQAKKGFLEYETQEELIEAFGWGDIEYDVYHAGLEYFENAKKPPQKSVIELHRSKIREMLDNWKGTVKELRDELNPPTPRVEENAFERLEREEREQRSSALRLTDALK